MDIKNIRKKVLNRETIMYGITGVFTMVAGVGLFQLLLYIDWDYKVANLVAIIIGKVLAYLANKFLVFRTKCDSVKEFFSELGKFIVARSGTALVDYFGVMLAVEICGFNEIYSKYFFTLLVVILNYFFGKKMVFKKKDINNEGEKEDGQKAIDSSSSL